MPNNKKVAAIICEYNPFHNGHKYHIDQTKNQTGADYVMCIMSGSMVQRGQIAITDKWQRAKIAVQNGADLVVELPAVNVLQSADNFAFGAVELLHAIGVVDFLSFGSETGDVEPLCHIANILNNPPDVFTNTLKEQMDIGIGYPAAVEAALSQCGVKDKLNPNDILAVNYIKALMQLKSGIKPVAVLRTNSYHSNLPSGDVASATAVRNMLKNGEDISSFVPQIPTDIYDESRLESLVIGFFRLADAGSLRHIAGMEEGLAERMIKSAKQSTCLEQFVAGCVTKRYTAHRIRRVIMCSILGIKKGTKANYLRILASNQNGFQIISQIKQNTHIPIVTKFADFDTQCNSAAMIDILATDVASICSSVPQNRIASRDYTTSPQIVNHNPTKNSRFS